MLHASSASPARRAGSRVPLGLAATGARRAAALELVLLEGHVGEGELLVVGGARGARRGEGRAFREEDALPLVLAKALLDEALDGHAARLHHAARRGLLRALRHEHRTHPPLEQPLPLVARRLVCGVAPLLGHVDAHVAHEHVVELRQRHARRLLELVLGDVVHCEAEAECLRVLLPRRLDVGVDQLDLARAQHVREEALCREELVTGPTA
mmetsp:Transcript_67471/g.163106  ORF Transcript_67471/g.163106 Transcript_67471/m.163106 type:complete len:211 (+) Transcript_67471:194-826(+)